MVIPEGDWFCPDCMHKELIKRLEEKMGEQTKFLLTYEVKDGIHLIAKIPWVTFV